MKKFLFIMLFASLLVSCDLLWDIIRDEDTPLEPDQFYAVDFTNNKNSFYTLRADRLAEGDKCVIWAEKGSGVTKAKAEKIAEEYDSNIRPKIVNAFGKKNFTAYGEHFDDILDYANALAGKKNGKLTILLLDIKDDFNGTTKRSFVAGYFNSGDIYRKNQVNTSNECDMIYVDTYPGLSPEYPKLEQQTYSTFAHELQHLINFTTTLLVERKNSDGKVSAMDTWIDEGLSSQAEHIYLGKPLEDRCEQFSKDEQGTIAKGNNFFVWGEKPDAILDEYATVYLFFRWLYLQADNNLRATIFKDIETANLSDHRVITTVAKKIKPEWEDWETLLSAWLAANYYPKNDYGYKGDSYFQKNIKVKPLTTPSISLYPGEGVYSNINSLFTPTESGANIRYRGLSDTSSTIVTGTTFTSTSDILLTFNANTNNKATAETGSLTGVAASVSSPSNSRMIIDAEQTETPAGPYIIDARDYNFMGILGRNK